MDDTDDVIEWADYYYVSQDRAVYARLGIPGLASIGWFHSRSAHKALPRHFHRDCLEITWVVQGNIVFSAEGKDYSLYGGDVFVTPANLPHGTENKPVGISEFYWTQINVREEPLLFLAPPWAAVLRCSLENLRTGAFQGTGFSRKYLADMFSLVTSALPDEKFEGISRLVTVLYQVIRSQAEMKDTPSQDIKKVIDWIRRHIRDEITLEDLADVAGLSLSHFKRKFYAQTGMSPRMLINGRKVDLARKLLSEGYSITDTAFEVGFNSSNYFSTVFRKFTYISPMEYVRKLRISDTGPHRANGLNNRY
jgi:AraC-like DNA-binding protein